MLTKRAIIFCSPQNFWLPIDLEQADPRDSLKERVGGSISVGIKSSYYEN